MTGHNLQLDSTDMSYSGYFGPFQVIFPTVDVLSDLSLAGRLWRGQDEGIVRRSFGFEPLVLGQDVHSFSNLSSVLAFLTYCNF